MRRRYTESDYIAAFMLLGTVFGAGFAIGLIFANLWLLML